MEISKDKETISSCLPSEKNVALIAEVKKFPSLYDTSNPDYYTLAERNKAWLQVAENLGQPADQCHLRWKSLRKRYAKERKKLPDIVRGHHKPWALYPKMSFVGPVNVDNRKRIKNISDKKVKPITTQDFNKIVSDDDMLIVDENNEIVGTCKSSEVSEEDEYIYETLDDPDSALEIMNSKLLPKVKATAIRSGKATRPPPAVPSRVGGSGRIRKLTTRMQNSFIAKKLKHAQQIMQQTDTPTSTVSSKGKVAVGAAKSCVVKLDKTINNKFQKPNHDQNSLKAESAKSESRFYGKQNTATDYKTESSPPKDGQSFKVVKLKGRNPQIFSPEQLPDIQSFLKAESMSQREQSKADDKSPVIKVKSVDHLNSMSRSSTSSESSNLDIIHSVGLMRKRSPEKQSKPEKTYSRAYSWNRPEAKLARQAVIEKAQPQPDSQTNDFEIEEAWNDIKEEIVDDSYWSQPQDDVYTPPEPMVMMTGESECLSRGPSRVTEAKLEMIAFQRKLMEEQHKKTLEFMKREHDLKMVLLRAEIDLKRKQLNIML